MVQCPVQIDEEVYRANLCYEKCYQTINRMEFHSVRTTTHVLLALKKAFDTVSRDGRFWYTLLSERNVHYVNSKFTETCYGSFAFLIDKENED